jgi:hypothetical protein
LDAHVEPAPIGVEQRSDCRRVYGLRAGFALAAEISDKYDRSQLELKAPRANAKHDLVGQVLNPAFSE